MSDFLKSIDTPGGHMFVCLFIVLLGAAFSKAGVPKGEDLIVGGSGALLMSMRAAAAAANPRRQRKQTAAAKP